MKKTKIFYGNQYIKSFRSTNRKYTNLQLLKIGFHRFMRKVTIVTVGTGATVLMFFILQSEYNNRPISAVNPVQTNDTLTSKIEQLETELLNTLQACESNGLTEEDGLVTFDPNPKRPEVEKASFGLLQFKKSTVIYYYDRLYDQDITGKEAIDIALGEETARQLARDIIFTTEGGLNNWYNCSTREGLYKQAEVINMLKA